MCATDIYIRMMFPVRFRFPSFLPVKWFFLLGLFT